MRYGGNTSCVEIICDDISLIFDAGTGLSLLGKDLLLRREGNQKDQHCEHHLFLSHTHFDHICGLPFFDPFFCENYHMHMWAGHLLPQYNIEKILTEFMKEPFFPVPYDVFKANLTFHDFYAGKKLTINPEITIDTAKLNHPNGATGYRVNYKGHSICYVTDTEHNIAKRDENIFNLIQDTDIFIYDSTYSDEQYKKKVGWGHSTWEEGVRLAKAANVKKFIIFHHDPAHNDDHMKKISEKSKKLFKESIVAKEGMVISVL